MRLRTFLTILMYGILLKKTGGMSDKVIIWGIKRMAAVMSYGDYDPSAQDIAEFDEMLVEVEIAIRTQENKDKEKKVEFVHELIKDQEVEILNKMMKDGN